MSKLQAFIFDVDGTIADTERDAHRVAFNRAFAEVGLAWNWSVERYGQLIRVAGGKERILAYRSSDDPEFQPAADLKPWAAELHQAKKRHYRELVSAGTIPLRPGVRRLIEQARAEGVRLAIATTSDPENVLVLLETSLAPESPTWFEVIAAGDMVAAKKPAPDVYLYALEKLALSPDECLAIEDSHQGLKAATRAGLKTVITCNGYTQTEDFTTAALVLDHLGEPNQPFRPLQGSTNQSTYFDIQLARHLLER